MRIATWNINGIKARLETLLDWLKNDPADVICLQEVKSVDEGFPHELFTAVGYHSVCHGQKGFNGVALLSRKPAEDVIRGLPGDEADAQARYIEASFAGEAGKVRVASIYLPNGNPVDSEKYPYKLGWMARLERHALGLLDLEQPVVLAGDYNVIPSAEDCWSPAVWAADALYLPQTRAAFQRLKNQGWTDGFRAVDDRPGRYSFWDYQAGAFQKDWGIRIDHLMLSPQAADQLNGVEIIRDLRAGEKPSDHVPVVGHFSF